jgi:cytochrome P450 family 135
MAERAGTAAIAGEERPTHAAAALERGLPPGPRLPRVAQTALALFANERYREYCRRRYRSMVKLNVAGVGEFVSVWEPELIRQVLTGDPDVLRGGEANARVLLAPAGANSVMVLDGERHLRTRRLLSPPFHGQAVRRYERLISQLAAAEVERWRVGETITTRTRMQAIALEVILQAVIGVRDERRLERLRALLGRVAGASVFAFAFESGYPRLAGGPLGARMPWIAARHEAEALLFEEIAEHRAEPDGREDILALLLAVRGEDEPLGDAELKDQLMTLLVAGHESTATVLAWCFERLVRHPHVLARLQRELAAADGERYLDAVVNETLRVRPVIELVARRLSAPLELGGYVLPAGTNVAVSISGVQHSDAYEDPQEFRPERFLGRPAPPYSLVPFGGGTHRCIGASFATMEVKSILRAVLERVELRASSHVDERAVRWRRITVIPSRGGRVVVSARRGP